MKSSALVVAASALAVSVSGDVKLAGIFNNRMVLQQGVPVPVWGTAAPGEQVTVKFYQQTLTTTADDQGRWLVKLKPLAAGGPFELIVTGKNKIVLQDVLVGEVWICSGQSNMEWPIHLAANAPQEIAAANFPQIRHFAVPKKISAVPVTDAIGQWVICDPTTIANFTAVGYFFGRELQQSLRVPIGLIHSSWGGTPAEAWTPQAAIASDPVLKPILDHWAQIDAAYPAQKEKHNQAYAEWKIAAQKAKAAGQPVPPEPPPPGPPYHNQGRASVLYNGMIAPLVPFAVRGVIWYQGESNTYASEQYRTLFPTLIKSWRAAWSNDFPFLFVQLANFMATDPQPAESGWAELREAQTMTLALPHTAMATTIDIGETADIHPRNKQDVGHRLALAARATVYGEKLTYSGPLYESMNITGNEVVLRFQHVGDGLTIKGDGPLQGFAIAGADKKFVWANARIAGDTVIVASDQVPQPVAVRYAWANNPVCNLYNQAGLPASPFRTDINR